MSTHNTLLALDTSTATGLVVLIHQTRIYTRMQNEPREHNRFLLAMVEEVLLDANIRLQAVDAFCAGIGPGSFVGVRLGVSVIQGLAYAMAKPVYALSSLALQAQAFFRQHPLYAEVVIAHDAKMQAVYLGAYRMQAARLTSIQPECLWCIQEPFDLQLSLPTVLSGNAAKLVASHTQVSASVIPGQPAFTGTDLADLALNALQSQAPLTPELLQPIYLQDEGHWQKIS